MSKKNASAKVETPADVSLLEGRVLIFAPTGNDAQLTLDFLVKAGLSAQAFREVPQLCEEVARGCGVIVLAEEVLAQSSIMILVEALSTQPSWSDIPIVLITSGGEVGQTRLRRLNIFGPGGNVIVLERPFRPATLVSTVEVALRSRQRQYETRKLVEDLHEARVHMEAALGVADICTWTWNLQSNLVNADKNMLRMFSLTPEDGENCPVEKYFQKVHPDDVAPIQAASQAARQSESGDYEADYRVIQAGGAVRWVTSRGRVEKDAAGKPSLFLGVNIDITERKRAEQALRASEEFNRSLMDGSVDCVKVLDLEGRLLAMNVPGMCVMEIDDFSSVCNRQWWELWPDKTRPEIMQAIAFAGEGRTSNFQAFCPTAKGTPKWWEVSVSAVRDRTDGQVVRLLSVSRDITERKRTEAVLLIQKQTFEMAASGAPLMEVLQMLAAGIEQHTEQQPMVAIHLLDETGTRFTRTAGAGLPANYAEAVDGMLVDSMTGPCCAAIVRRHRVAVADVANDTEFPQFAAFAVPAGIRAGWSMPILSSQGAVIGTVAHYYRQPLALRAGDDVLAQIVSRTASLVIERKQAEEALGESKAQLTAEANALGRLNDASSRLWQLPELQAGLDEMVSATVTMLGADMGNIQLYDAERGELRIVVQRGFKQDFLDSFGTVTTKDDSASGRILRAGQRTIVEDVELDEPYAPLRPVAQAAGYRSVQSTPLMGRDGQLLGMLSTHWKRPHRANDHELRRLDLYVGQVVDFIERRKAQEVLRAARDNAEKASRAKDDFLAALSHELRTPLNPALLIASEAANDKQLPEEVRRNFETIRKNIELEARLIDDLLDLTRITTGKMVLEKKVVDVHDVLLDALATVQAERLGKKIQIVSDFTEGPAQVSGDPVRLEQIFWNILKNAVKFTPANGKIDVRTSRADGNLKITFTDTGIGMKAEEVARVFEAFAQGDHASGGGSHRFGGLGLGLAISKKLVEIHAGKIFAESAGPNRGAVFTIELPLAQKIKNKNDSRPDADGTSPVGIPRPDGAQISVLLVEDHDATRTVLAQLLVRRNYKVIHTNTIASARTLAGQNKFDLLISDIGLPDGNGNDLMKEFQARYGLKGIALTGYGMEEDIERGKAAGFVTHLIKPVRIQSLEKALSVFSKT